MSLELAIQQNTQALTALLSHLQTLTPTELARVEAPVKAAAQDKPRKAKPEPVAAPVAPALAEPPVAPLPAAQEAPAAAHVIARGDVAALISKAIEADKREQVRACLKRVGADRFSCVEFEDLPKLAAMVQELLDAKP